MTDYITVLRQGLKAQVPPEGRDAKEMADELNIRIDKAREAGRVGLPPEVVVEQIPITEELTFNVHKDKPRIRRA